ncbi:MAG: FtsH protease activity modulator HflK [Pseudomonadota bacterium]
MSTNLKNRLKRAGAGALGGPRRLVSFFPSPPALLFIAFLAWVISGVFVIAPDEIGVVKTFGLKSRTEKPGIHYHLPYPISSALKVKIGRVHRMEFGFREAGPDQPPRPAADEARMPTGDENLVDLWFVVQYRINNAERHLFQVRDPEAALRAAAEAVMREVVGRSRLDEVLTSGKDAIAKEAAADLQAVLDAYKLGVTLTAVQLQAVQPPPEVRDAFQRVASARDEQNKVVNEAQGYVNEIIPEAKGEAAAVVLEAEAYREEKLKQAQGDAARFLSLWDEYRQAENVTRLRLYLEGMEDMLSRAGRIVLDPRDRNVLPLLQMSEPGSPPQAALPAGREGRGDHE